MKFQYKLITILFTAVALVGFFACDDAPQITKTIIDEILTDPIPVTQSRYTGGLQRVGTVKGFGDSGVHTPIAIEWNGQSLYMIAEKGYNERAGLFLFSLNRHTGTATIINPSAIDLGGSFRGRSFTKVYGVNPNDMAWDSTTNQMLATCGLLDRIVLIDLDTGEAIRITTNNIFNVLKEQGHRFSSPRGIAYDGIQLFIAGVTPYPSSHNPTPRNAELLKVSNNLKYAQQIFETPPIQFNAGETTPYALCFAEGYLYMSGADTDSLYIIDRETGVAYFIAKWYYTQIPIGHAIHNKETGKDTSLTEMPPDHDGTQYCYRNIQRNLCVDFPDITGLAFDGIDMFAIDARTNGLYKLEKR